MWGRAFIVGTAVCAFTACAPLVGLVEDRLNGVASPNDPALTNATVPNDAQLALHGDAFIADMHADTLLWGRDFIKRSSRGHVDVPRLREGNVRLQVLSIVTSTPIGDGEQNPIREGALNSSAVLSALQGRPVGAWFSARKRALTQLAEFHDRLAKSAPGETVFVKDLASLEQLMKQWRSDRGSAPVGLMLGVEGAHWLGDADDEDIDSMIDELWTRGVRMVALTHRFDNRLSGASEGISGSGLTPRGEAVLRKLDAKGFVVDLAHISPPALVEALKVARGPVVVSHAGVWATTPRHRNLSDDELRLIAANGGVIGIGYWPQAVGKANLDYEGNYLDAIGDAFEATVAALAQGAGEDPSFDPYAHVGLGSDFDGAVFVPFDASKLSLLTATLLQRGFPPEKVRLVLGLNFCRVLVTRWGSGADDSKRICAGELPVSAGE